MIGKQRCLPLINKAGWIAYESKRESLMLHPKLTKINMEGMTNSMWTLTAESHDAFINFCILLIWIQMSRLPYQLLHQPQWFIEVDHC